MEGTVIMRTRLDMDAPYIVHPRSAALHYAPLPTAILRQLHNLRALMRHAPSAEEVTWLEAQIDLITVECADCPPARVRNVEAPRRDRPPRHEQRYGRRGYGPTNASGRAKS